MGVCQAHPGLPHSERLLEGRGRGVVGRKVREGSLRWLRVNEKVESCIF